MSCVVDIPKKENTLDVCLICLGEPDKTCCIVQTLKNKSHLFGCKCSIWYHKKCWTTFLNSKLPKQCPLCTKRLIPPKVILPSPGVYELDLYIEGKCPYDHTKCCNNNTIWCVLCCFGIFGSITFPILIVGILNDYDTITKITGGISIAFLSCCCISMCKVPISVVNCCYDRVYMWILFKIITLLTAILVIAAIVLSKMYFNLNSDLQTGLNMCGALAIFPIGAALYILYRIKYGQPLEELYRV